MGVLALLTALLFPCLSFGHSAVSKPIIAQSLEDLLGREMTPLELNKLEQQMHAQWPISNSAELLFLSWRQPRSSSAVLFCLRGEFDLYVGAGISGCVDTRLRRYYLLTGGAGLSIGVAASVFTLIYRSKSGSDVSGVYYGGKWSVAWGKLGGSAGVFLRKGGQSDRLYWLGWVGGATFDLAPTILQIERF